MQTNPQAENAPAPSWRAGLSRPALALPTRGGVYLLTESGEVSRFDHENLTWDGPAPALEQWSSATVVEPSGTLVVGLYDGMTATLEKDDWSYRAADAPVLAMASCPQGFVVGDAKGSVVFHDLRGEVLALEPLGEPVVELFADRQGVLALGSRGALARLRWPELGLVPIDRIMHPKHLGPFVGLFATGLPTRLGAYSAERLALIDTGTGHVSVSDRSFADGIRQVVPLESGGKRLVYGVVTDLGVLWIVEADRKEARPVSLPGDSGMVIALEAAKAEGWLAWTSTGALFAIERERMYRIVMATHVCMTYSHSDTPDRHWAVRWVPDQGIQVVPVRFDQAR